MFSSSGKALRTLVIDTPPVQLLGVINAYAAQLAEAAGAQALYLSGAGVANASYGLPDLGMTGLTDVLEDVRRITDTTTLPLLVDIDTGFGHLLNVSRTVKQMERAGVAAVHIEDQRTAKRCGHRPNKTIISEQEMGDRIKAAVDARIDPDFILMARTDAYAVDGMQAALDRAAYYVELGADMIFPEALTTLDEYHQFTAHTSVPVLANITEFGKTPLFTRDELGGVGVQLLLYPLSAFRAMSKAASDVYQAILHEGTQQSMVKEMQTREELYQVLNYTAFEQKMDAWEETVDG
ncbi:MAG: methylisocitrate lyase [Gammaproteobacteria bacterium]|nr:methylisocitrate lyase [Gammaproteobacteria bacterium]